MALEMKYFVLKPRSKETGDIYAKASREAMMTYATIIKRKDPKLAKSLDEWAMDEVHRAINLHLRKK